MTPHHRLSGAALRRRGPCVVPSLSLVILLCLCLLLPDLVSSQATPSALTAKVVSEREETWKERQQVFHEKAVARAYKALDVLVKGDKDHTTPTGLHIDVSGETPFLRPRELPRDRFSHWPTETKGIPRPKAPQTPNTCSFNGCPADQPFLYVFTPHRNRAASYNRLVRTLLEDVTGDGRQAGECVCLVVVDFVAQQMEPFVSRALEDWPFGYKLIELDGLFSPGRAFQTAIRFIKGNGTPLDKSYILRMDADVVTYPGAMYRVVSMIQPGYRGYAPVLWSTTRPNDNLHGFWRAGGTGMISFAVSDFERCLNGTIPLNDRVDWGKEDGELYKALDGCKDYRIKRTCTPEMWHLWHPKAKWRASANGFSTKTHTLGAPFDPENPNAWRVDLPIPYASEYLRWSGHLLDDRCILSDAGVRFPRAVVSHENGVYPKFRGARYLNRTLVNEEAHQMDLLGLDIYGIIVNTITY